MMAAGLILIIVALGIGSIFKALDEHNCNREWQRSNTVAFLGFALFVGVALVLASVVLVLWEAMP